MAESCCAHGRFVHRCVHYETRNPICWGPRSGHDPSLVVTILVTSDSLFTLPPQCYTLAALIRMHLLPKHISTRNVPMCTASPLHHTQYYRTPHTCPPHPYSPPRTPRIRFPCPITYELMEPPTHPTTRNQKSGLRGTPGGPRTHRHRRLGGHSPPPRHCQAYTKRRTSTTPTYPNAPTPHTTHT
jgi:hypothetical protein